MGVNMVSAPVKWKPRNDYVLIRVVDLGSTPGGIVVSDYSIEGKEFVIVAVGEQVKGLVSGDKVLMLGTQGVNYFPLPNSKDLIVMKQEHVVLVQERE